MKKYILIAGVNGAGKSTLYHTLPHLQDVPRINTDEIIKDFGGKWNEFKDVLKAGKIALEMIERYFVEEKSFHQETTLCGRAILQNIRRAKKEGYIVEIHYVGVDSVEVAKKRVHQRVMDGGHGIPDKDIERRYSDSFKNLLEILDEIDIITFYDNTDYFERIAVCRNGETEVITKEHPQWFQNLELK